MDDQLDGFLDFATFSTFTNQEFLYGMITVNNQDHFDQLLIRVRDNSGNAGRLEFFPGAETRFSLDDGASRTLNAEYSFGEVIEFKVSFEEIGFVPTSFDMVENCCGVDYARGDQIDGAAIVQVAETEPSKESAADDSSRFPSPPYAVAGGRGQGEYLDMGEIVAFGEIAWGPDGFLYVCDNMKGLAKVSPDGEVILDELWNDHTLFAKDGPRAIAFDEDGNLFLANHSTAVLYLPSGEIEELPGVSGAPIGDIAFGPDGAFYFTSRNDNGGLYRLETPYSDKAVLVAQLPFAEYMAFTDDGFAFVSQLDTAVSKVNLETGDSSVFISQTMDPAFLLIDNEGDLWVRDLFGLQQYSPDGRLKQFNLFVHGDWRLGSQFGWHTSAGIALDPDGNIWASTYVSAIWKLEPAEPGQPDPDFYFYDIYEGMRITGLAFGLDGSLYAFNENDEDLYKYLVGEDGLLSGERERLFDFGDVDGPGGGPGVVALDEQGALYVSYQNKVFRFVDDKIEGRYAQVGLLSMTIGKDGAIYGIHGGHGNPASLVRIPSADNVETILSSIEGRQLGRDFLFIARYGDAGFLVHDFGNRTLYFVDYEGNASILKEDFGTPWIGAVYVTPVSGQIFYMDHEDIKWISPDGSEMVIYAINTSSDATMMVISPDEEWIYFTPNGALARIPLIDFWWE